MKLYELTGVKAHHEKSFDELDAMFGGKGSTFKPLGGGLFAKVYGHDSGVVYKFWAKDTAYEKYVEYCLKNQSNPFIPKFSSKIKTLTVFFKRPASFPDKIKYVKMEKLAPYRNQYLPGTDSPYYSVLKLLVSEVENDESFETVVSDITRFSKKGSIASVRKSYENLLEEQPLKLIKELFDTLVDIHKHVGKLNDLHNENIMMRGDQLVILDPAAVASETNDMTALWSAISHSGDTRVGPARKSARGKQ